MRPATCWATRASPSRRSQSRRRERKEDYRGEERILERIPEPFTWEYEKPFTRDRKEGKTKISRKGRLELRTLLDAEKKKTSLGSKRKGGQNRKKKKRVHGNKFQGGAILIEGGGGRRGQERKPSKEKCKKRDQRVELYQERGEREGDLGEINSSFSLSTERKKMSTRSTP